MVAGLIRRKEAKERLHLERLAAYLRNRIVFYQDRLEESGMEDEEKVKIAARVERLRRIVAELEAV